MRQYDTHVEQIDEYVEISGDDNPLHTDSAFAMRRGYQGRIVHGHLLLAFLSDAMARDDWRSWWFGGGLNVRFVKPVYIGEVVDVRIEPDGVVSRSADARRRYSVQLSVGDRLVVAGTAWRREESLPGEFG